MSTVNGTELWDEESQTVALLRAVLELAKDDQVRSVGLVLVDGDGEYRVTAAGPDVDGLCAGSEALWKELKKLLPTKKPSKLILLNG